MLYLFGMETTYTTIILQEGRGYVAQCVELGVVSQGKTVDLAQKNLREAVRLYLKDSPKRRRAVSRHAPLVTTMRISHV